MARHPRDEAVSDPAHGGGRPLGVPRWGWVGLVVVDALLLSAAILSGRIDYSLGALVLALVIEHFAHETLVGSFERWQAERRERLGGQGLSAGQWGEVLHEFHRERRQRRRERRQRGRERRRDRATHGGNQAMVRSQGHGREERESDGMEGDPRHQGGS